MIRQLTSALADLTVYVLPASQKPWGAAMKEELRYIQRPGEALVYASGCIWAATLTRIRSFDTLFGGMLWLLAAATLVFASLQLSCAIRGLAALSGGPDGLYTAMISSHGQKSELVTKYESARPFIVFSFFVLAIGHLILAWLLIQGQVRRFAFVWLSTFVIATISVAIQLSILWDASSIPSEFHGLLVQGLALSLLLTWSDGRHLQSRKSK
jgi:hypothetical protein